MRPMKSPEYIVILCTCPNQETAEQIASQLVSEKLAACVNLIPGITSIYQWESAVQKETECQLLIKTEHNQFAAIENHLKDNHPYDVPEILALPIVAGHEPYLDWISQNVQ